MKRQHESTKLQRRSDNTQGNCNAVAIKIDEIAVAIKINEIAMAINGITTEMNGMQCKAMK